MGGCNYYRTYFFKERIDMQHLLAQWNQLSKKIKNNRICIFLDYDGTLTEIADTPQQARLPQETKSILQKL